MNPIDIASKKRNKKWGGTGCTLDSGNLGAIAFAWTQVAKTDTPHFKGFQLFLGDKNDTSRTMWEHDPQLLKMLRSWVQATNMVDRAIAARVKELEEIAALPEYIAAQAALAVPESTISDTAPAPVTDAEEKLIQEYESSGEYKLENPGAANETL